MWDKNTSARPSAKNAGGGGGGLCARGGAYLRDFTVLSNIVGYVSKHSRSSYSTIGEFTWDQSLCGRLC